MDDEAELREEIVHLESEIERLAETMESCRKLILLSKLAGTLAGALIAAALIGAINLDPALMIGGLGVILGALVVFGSNTSTLDRATAASKAAELRRAQLIGQIDLRLVTSRTIH